MARPNFESHQRQRMQDRERNDQVSAKLVRYTVFITCLEPGEAVTDVIFPVIFTQVPGLSYSYHLGDNQVVETGNYPELQVGVHHFATVEQVAGVVYYKGAHVVLRIAGPAGMVLVAHVHFEGKALVNPLTPDAGVV